MKSFKIFIEELLFEITVNEPIDRDVGLEQKINHFHRRLISTKDTRAFHTKHLADDGKRVLRIVPKHDTTRVEYHIHNENAKNGSKPKAEIKSAAHIRHIIDTDSHEHLNSGKHIWLQGANDDQNKSYRKYAENFVKKYPNHKIIDHGKQPTTDGVSGEKHAISIHRI